MKMSGFFLLLTTFIFFYHSDVYARRSGDKDRSPLLEARYVEDGPVVDGDATDPVWEHAVPDSAFHALGVPDETSTLSTVRVLYDDTSLYILFVWRGQPEKGLMASTIRRDGSIWETDDDVEFFFYPRDQDSLYVQLSTNAIGAKFDSQTSRKDYYKDFTWTAMPGWFEDHWVVELEIPLNQFVESVKEGEVWRVNFARHVQVSPDSVSKLTWAPMTRTLFEGENFGRMRFKSGTAFKVTPLSVDWTADESRAISNLRKLRGGDVYQPIKDYLDIVLTLRSMKRPFEVLSRRVIDFITEFPDSSTSLEFALRSIFPAASGYRVRPGVVDTLVLEIEATIDLQGVEKDLLDLSRGLFYNEMGQREKWIAIYRSLSGRDPQIRATAAYYVLSLTEFRPSPSSEDLNLLKDALVTFTDLAITDSTPVHLKQGVIWPATSPTRSGIYGKFYNVLKKTGRIIPEEVMALTLSLSSTQDIPDELATALKRIAFEQYSGKKSPYYSQQKADSLILEIAPHDKEYAKSRLNSLLRERIRELDAVYSAMGRDSLTGAIKNAVVMRNHYEGFHPSDLVFATSSETADSRDKAVEYLETYLESLGEEWQRSGPVTRYLSEVKFRRDHRSEPRFYDITRNSFRLIYRIQGFRKPADFLDISSDGRAAIYTTVPDSLDPRNRIEVTVSARIDSPAVAFRLSSGEIDSLHTLLSKYDFLEFKLKYTEPCYQCGNTEITVLTPWNVRTIHLEGEDLAKAPFRLKKDVSSILDKYLHPLYQLRSDWKGRFRYYTLWGKYNSPGKSPDERLDLLLELFKNEPMRSSWQNEEWYVEPLIELGKETGRNTEVDAAIGVRYFDSIFKWKSYTKERLPKKTAEEIAKARDYLDRAASGARKERRREWYGFLSEFAQNFSGDLVRLSKEIERLSDPKNRGNARLILIWLACAKGDLEMASSIHTTLLGQKAGKDVKFASTLRIMLSNMDHNRPEEALKYLRQIEKEYMGNLSDRRDRPIKELEQYSRVDLLLDKAQLSFRVGDLVETEALVRSIDESDVPPDMTNEYQDLLRLVKYRDLPSTYSMLELSDYLRVLSASSHSGLYELSARWAMWLLENLDDQKLRSQITSMLMGSFQGREEWDELQEKMARTLLDDYRSDPTWKSTDLTERILEKVIEHGEVEDVRKFWREEILPQPMRVTRITALDRLANYFQQKQEPNEQLEVLEKILREARQNGADLPIARLILVKYTIDLAGLYTTKLNRREAGVALVDSLSENLSDLGVEVYPYVFAVVAEWKAKYIGWQALVDFVSPRGDSLLKAEKELEWSVYRPHLLPDTPLASPLLALRCIVQQRGLRRHDTDFFELLGLTSDTADSVLKNLRVSPSRLNLSCEQAQLLNWKEGSFEAILEQYNHRVR